MLFLLDATPLTNHDEAKSAELYEEGMEKCDEESSDGAEPIAPRGENETPFSRRQPASLFISHRFMNTPFFPYVPATRQTTPKP